ncbi:MAG: hypothetical protein ACRDCW_04735 [Sarcina sp.]
MFRRKERSVKIKKEKKGFFKKKEKKNVLNGQNSHNQNLHINEQVLKNQIKNELIKEVNSAFIINLRNEIKKDLKKEMMSQINIEVLNSIKNGLKEKVKKEIRIELKEEIRKDILLELQIKETREKNLREKLTRTNKKSNDIHINVSDEDLIRHFLASEDFKEVVNKQKGLEKSLILEIKKEEPQIREKLVDLEKKSRQNDVKVEAAITRTEVMCDDSTTQLGLDRTQFDMARYEDDDMFFEEEEVNSIEAVDSSFKDSLKAFAKEQGANIKKAGSDIKTISQKGYEISKEELERLKNSEAFKNYVKKIKELKN